MAGNPNGLTWLASYPKSGSTWLRLFMTAYIYDGVIINANALPRMMMLTDNNMNDFFRIAPAPVHLLSHYEMLLIRGAVLVDLMRSHSTRPLPVKTHSANSILDGVRLFPPIITDRSIYVVRDPRDVAVSFSEWRSATIDETIEGMATDSMILHNDVDHAKTVFQFMSSWSKHVCSWNDDDMNVLFIQYERMHEDPFKVFSDVVKHLDWEYDEDRVRRSIRSVSFSNMQKHEEKHGFSERAPTVEKFFRRGEVGGWKDVLTPEQSDRIANDHGETMQRLGYL